LAPRHKGRVKPANFAGIVPLHTACLNCWQLPARGKTRSVTEFVGTRIMAQLAACFLIEPNSAGPENGRDVAASVQTAR
jgi:hypothetical protein